MEKKICIITGANSGIGKQAAGQIAERGHHVLLACRNRERGTAVLEEFKRDLPNFSGELMVVDMGLRSSILDFAREFSAKYSRLDVLIHNAAVFDISQKEAQYSAEGIETVWATNHIGPVLMTELLLPQMKASEGARIITIASKGLLAKPCLRIRTEDPEFRSARFRVANAYYHSKLAQIMYRYWLAEREKTHSINVNCIRVPAVKVDISRHPDISPFMKWVYSQKAKGSIEPAEMARTYTELALSNEYRGVSGCYFDEACRNISSGSYSIDSINIAALMATTRQYVPELGKA